MEKLMIFIKLKRMFLTIGIFSFTPICSAQTHLLPVSPSIYQEDIKGLKPGYCISNFKDKNNNVLGVAINGSKLYLNLNNKGILYLLNINYESRQGDIKFITTRDENNREIHYALFIKNLKKISNHQYSLDIQLYRKQLGGNQYLLFTQPVTLQETCKSGDFQSVVYQRSKLSKLMQILFFRH